ncbi:MAG: AarF/ABC1/UbiB kinase family protein [Deltaproteobacteria bacterium]|nr:AarF/ABC1/UbiB kinase family protein [Deltaproteobacteria bacterium]
MAPRPSRFGVAWTAARLASRRVLRRKEGARDRELGEQLTGQLDQMKGLAMKLGQIVSYMDVPLPDSVQQQLARLQTGEHGLSPSQTRAALEDALGPDFEQHFEAFDMQPIAAASIGQVHRARFGGQAIALKLQYPGVADSFRKDLGAMRPIASLASLASAVDGPAIVQELGARLAEECDYLREAAFVRAFGRAFADEPQMNIPQVIAPLTTATTLATTWAAGEGFEDACQAPVELRTAYARTLVRFGYRSLLESCTVQADPHPGNFLFGPGPRVTFVDFGCVRGFDPELIGSLRAMIEAIDHGDRPAFRDSVMAVGMTPKPERIDFDHLFAMMEHLHRPLLQPRFRFSPDFVRQGLAYNGPTNPNVRHLSIPPPYIWIARLQWGLWSLLTRLRADLPLRDILDEVMRTPIASMPRHGQHAPRAH